MDTLLEAWADAPGRLVVVGAGPDEQRLRREASPSVEFRGQVPRSEIPRILGGARALLVPSICEEAFGRAATEAYAAGVPAVASRIGGLNEIVEHERSGLLVEPRRAQDWADAAERLLDDGESERLGQGGWELWHERYRPEVGLARLEEAYRKARAFAGAGAGMA